MQTCSIGITVFRFMEVFLGDEYVSTQEGVYVEQLEDNIKLYILQKSFDQPVLKVFLKVADSTACSITVSTTSIHALVDFRLISA